MSKPRLVLYDNLKLLMIIFVIIGHMVDYGGSLYTSSDTCYRAMVFIYAFHMPLFILMAGLFFKAQNILKKVLYYLTVGLLMKAVIFGFQRCLYHTGVFTFLDYNGPEWFMLALAVYTAVTPLLRRLNRWAAWITLVLVALVAGYLDIIGTVFSLSRILVFYPFFFAGTVMDAEKLDRLLHRPRLRIAGGVILLLWTVAVAVFGDNIWWMKYLFTGSSPYSYLPDGLAGYGGILRAVSYLLAGLLCLSFLAVMPSKKLGLLSTFGSRTLQVYFWHLPLVFAVHTLDYTFFDTTLARNPGGYCLGIIVAVGIAMLLSLKPFQFPTALIKSYLFRQKS